MSNLLLPNIINTTYLTMHLVTSVQTWFFYSDQTYQSLNHYSSTHAILPLITPHLTLPSLSTPHNHCVQFLLIRPTAFEKASAEGGTAVVRTQILSDAEAMTSFSSFICKTNYDWCAVLQFRMNILQFRSIRCVRMYCNSDLTSLMMAILRRERTVV